MEFSCIRIPRRRNSFQRLLSALKSRGVNYLVRILHRNVSLKTRSNTDFTARPTFLPERSDNTSSAPQSSSRVAQLEFQKLHRSEARAGSSRCTFKFSETRVRSSRGNAAGRRHFSNPVSLADARPPRIALSTSTPMAAHLLFQSHARLIASRLISRRPYAKLRCPHLRDLILSMCVRQPIGPRLICTRDD